MIKKPFWKISGVKIMLFFCCAIILAIFAASCDYAEITDFVHEPTSQFPITPNIDSVQLDEYRFADVLFVPQVTHLDYETSKIEMYLYSDSEVIKPLMVEGVALFADSSAIIQHSTQIKINLSYDKDSSNMHTGTVVLIKSIQDVVIKEASSLTLVVNVEMDNITKKITYYLKPSRRKYLIQR